MSTRKRVITALLGVAVFGILMAVRGQVSDATARGVIAALAFACLGASLMWVVRKADDTHR